MARVGFSPNVAIWFEDLPIVDMRLSPYGGALDRLSHGRLRDAGRCPSFADFKHSIRLIAEGQTDHRRVSDGWPDTSGYVIRFIVNAPSIHLSEDR